MSFKELREHLGYWRDDIKIDAYRKALQEVIEPGDQVIDLGSGSGLLGMLAVQAGAGHVTAYDVGEILAVARDLAEANGVADRMDFRQEFTVKADLPPADVIVCDQIGGLAFDAGVLEYFADAEARALKPGGRLVPASFDLFLGPVEAPTPYKNIADWSDRGGFDLGPAREFAVNTEHYVAAGDVTKCADGVRFASIASSFYERLKGDCSFTVTAPSTMHGLAGWFEADLSPSVRISSDPALPDRFTRWLNFYPVREPIELVAGDQVRATIDIRPDTKLVNWSVAVNDAAAARYSTFFGELAFKKPNSGRLG